MSWTQDFLDALAQDLHDAQIGVWDPTGTTGNIITGALPPSLDQGIGLQDYGLMPDHVLADVIQPVQLWLRGDDAWVKTTRDAIFDRYEGAVNRVYGTVACPLSTQHSDARMGVDGKGRVERALNYYFSVLRPNQYRTD